MPFVDSYRLGMLQALMLSVASNGFALQEVVQGR